MVTKNDFAASDWNTLRDTPYLVGLATLFAEPSGLGTIKESIAMAMGIWENQASEIPLIRDLTSRVEMQAAQESLKGRFTGSQAAWSPDGKRVVFHRHTAQPAPAPLIKMFSRNPNYELHLSGPQPSFSPTGKQYQTIGGGTPGSKVAALVLRTPETGQSDIPSGRKCGRLGRVQFGDQLRGLISPNPISGPRDRLVVERVVIASKSAKAGQVLPSIMASSEAAEGIGHTRCASCYHYRSSPIFPCPPSPVIVS
jgi:hypothetical protein